MSSSRSSAGVAGRYASALFDLARDEGLLYIVEGDLAAIAKALATSADLRRLIKSPVFSADDQGKALGALAEKFEFNPLTRNVLGVLAKNRRLFALDAVIEIYGDLVAEYKGETKAEAITAVPLDAERTQRLKTEIEAAVGRAVRLETKTDPALLGGLVVKVGSRMIDSSLRTKLQRMQTAMKGA